MKIVEIKVMRGPNYWSNYRKKLIVMKLDLGKYEELPSHMIEGFAERLEKLIPSLHEHHCSPGVEGGFLKRLRSGTWMGHVIEHVALELQTLAGMDCGFGRTRSAKEKGVYNVVFSYELEKAGIYAAKAAVDLVEHVAEGKPFDISEDIRKLSRIKRREGFGPSTHSIAEEAAKRNIPVMRLDSNSHLLLGQGCYQKKIRATVASTTSHMAVDLVADKEKTKQLLAGARIPVPEGRLVEDREELLQAIAEIGFPLAIKPVNGNHGRGITTGIGTQKQAEAAYEQASAISRDVIVERYVHGDDYRFLLINYKLVAVAKRQPAMVTGDGRSSILELVMQANKDPERGEGHEKMLTTIKIDEATCALLERKNLGLDSVPGKGEVLYLKDTANMSTGGTSTDVTEEVHPFNVLMAERIARLTDLNICGIDIIAEDIGQPITPANGAVLEVNAGPGFRMHLAPSRGKPRNVAKPVIDMLFPGDSPSRIPLVAITGTNGKTTVTRLTAHLAKCVGYSVGYTTTEGIYLNNTLIYSGDCSGPASAQVVLNDPLVNFAVLECARGGILRSGLGFDQCDISIITNVTEDHLGMGGIHTLRELANVKIVVARSTQSNGHAILNADDDRVYAMRRELDCNIALFSLDPENERIRRHCESGGLAAVVEDGFFTLCRSTWKTKLIRVEDVPLTFEGKAEFMIQNVLPVILVGAIRDIKTEDIVTALTTFHPSPENTPGRMNMFRFRKFDVLVDYFHNSSGFIEMKKYLSRIESPMKIGVISATGDRRDEDIRNIGYHAAQMFDDIIIRHDKDCRGRPKEEISRLITEGILSADPDATPVIISDEWEAIQHAMNHAREQAIIVVGADKVPDTLAFVKKKKGEEEALQLNNINLSVSI